MDSGLLIDNSGTGASTRLRQKIEIGYWESKLTAPMSGASQLSEEKDADARLMEQVAEGDNDALASLINKWKRPLISYFYRSLSSVEDAEDLTLKTFGQLHRAATRYQAKAKFSTYLFQIAHRLLLNEWRRRHRKPVDLVEPEKMRYLATSDENASRRVLELEDIFQLAIQRIPENYRTPLLLIKQQELSHQEIARILNISENALNVKLHRGRRRLRQIMEELQ